MTESEARLILGADASADSEDLIDAYEEAVFELASFFMRRTFIPKLAKAKISKLQKVGEVARFFEIDLSKIDEPSFSFSFENLSDHRSVIQAYNQAEMKIKLKLSSTSSYTEALSLYASWIQLFNEYSKAFLKLCVGSEIINVKLTEAPIFVEFQNASEAERQELIRRECARLKKMIG
jgi:hypothetical protein